MAVFFQVSRLFCPRCGLRTLGALKGAACNGAVQCKTCLTKMRIELILDQVPPEAMPGPTEFKEDEDAKI